MLLYVALYLHSSVMYVFSAYHKALPPMNVDFVTKGAADLYVPIYLLMVHETNNAMFVS